MRSNLTRTVLAAAALATSAGLACAQVAARIDGTGAGLNAGVGASSSLDPSTSGSPNNSTGVPGSGSGDANGNIATPSANDPRVLGSGHRMHGNIVPDNLPGTIGGQSNATVGINGTGTLDGSVPSTDVGVDRGLGVGVQR